MNLLAPEWWAEAAVKSAASSPDCEGKYCAEKRSIYQSSNQPSASTHPPPLPHRHGRLPPPPHTSLHPDRHGHHRRHQRVHARHRFVPGPPPEPVRLEAPTHARDPQLRRRGGERGGDRRRGGRWYPRPRPELGQWVRGGQEGRAEGENRVREGREQEIKDHVFERSARVGEQPGGMQTRARSPDRPRHDQRY